MDRAERIGQLLLARGWRVSVAESTAGGLISAALLKVAGASRYYERGVVAYSRAAKIDTGASAMPRWVWRKAVWLVRALVAPGSPSVPCGRLWSRLSASYNVSCTCQEIGWR